MLEVWGQLGMTQGVELVTGKNLKSYLILITFTHIPISNQTCLRVRHCSSLKINYLVANSVLLWLQCIVAYFIFFAQNMGCSGQRPQYGLVRRFAN